MEAQMLKILTAGMTAIVVITGSSFGYAQSPSDGPVPNLSAADLNALTDARIGLVKTALQLTSEQDKYWPAIEEAIRSRAKERQTRLADTAARVAEKLDRSPIEILRDRNPVEFLNRRSDALA